MDSNNRSIKASQFMFLVSGFVYGSFLLLSFLTGLTGHDLWIVLLVGFLVCILFLVCLSALVHMLPGKNLHEMLISVYGRVLGTVLSVFYFLYFFLILSFNLADVGDFYTGYIMTDTPKMLFMAVFAILCVYSAVKGMQTVSKISFITLIMGFSVAFLTTILSIKSINLSYFLPIFDMRLADFAKSLSILVAIPFGEIVALLYVTPLVQYKKKLSRYLIGGIAIVTTLFLIITFRNISTLGPSGTIYAQSAYQSVRMINIKNFVTRIELAIALVITMGFFIKASVLCYVTANSISHLLNLKSYKSLLFPIGSIAVVIASIRFPSTVAHADWGDRYAVFFSLPFTLFLPVLTLLVGKLRKLPKQVADK